MCLLSNVGTQLLHNSQTVQSLLYRAALLQISFHKTEKGYPARKTKQNGFDLSNSISTSAPDVLIPEHHSSWTTSVRRGLVGVADGGGGVTGGGCGWGRWELDTFDIQHLCYLSCAQLSIDMFVQIIITNVYTKCTSAHARAHTNTHTHACAHPLTHIIHKCIYFFFLFLQSLFT